MGAKQSSLRDMAAQLKVAVAADDVVVQRLRATQRYAQFTAPDPTQLNSTQLDRLVEFSCVRSSSGGAK